MPKDDEIIQPYRSGLTLTGRLLLAAIFLLSGINKLLDPQSTQQYMAAKGMVRATALFSIGALLFEIGGALSLLLGGWARVGAGALVLFLIPTTIMFHYTSMSFVIDATVHDQQFHVMKNLAIMGGLLYVWAYGAGPMSLDGLRR